MAEFTKEATFKAVQIDALVRATFFQRENPAGRPAIVLFATRFGDAAT
jgi:hypothetical protein